jgi:hypothetical protein
MDNGDIIAESEKIYEILSGIKVSIRKGFAILARGP